VTSGSVGPMKTPESVASLPLIAPARIPLMLREDHIVALCDGGPDSVSNLQWQTKADAKAKGRTECRSRKTLRH